MFSLQLVVQMVARPWPQGMTFREFPWDETDDFKPHVPNNNNVRFTIGALAYEISCRKDDPYKPFERVNWNNNVDTDIDILLRKLNTDIVKVFCRFGNPPNA